MRIRIGLVQGRSELWLKALACFLFICLFSFQLRQTWFASPQYDDSANASVSKNVALGLGYKTTYQVDKPFNHRITTGPALLLPAAALINIFGNAYWTPSATTVLISSSLVLFIFFLSGRVFETDFNRWLFLSLTLFFFLMFTTEIPTLGNPGFLQFWHKLIGEAPAALWICAAVLLLAAVRPLSAPQSLLAGLFGGLAYLTKVIAIFGFAPLVALLLLVADCPTPRFSARKGLLFLVLICGFLLPIAGFEYAKKASVSPAVYAAMKKSEAKFFRDHGSGIDQFLGAPNKIRFLAGRFKQNGGILIHYFGTPLRMGMFFALIILILVGIRGKRLSHSALGGLALLSGFYIHLFWWLFFSMTSWIEHLMMGLIYGFVGISLIIASLGSRAIRISAVALVLLLAGPRFWDFVNFIPRSFEREPQLVALLDTRDFIERELAGKATLMGCGWWANRDLEFVLPSSGNFKDCLRLDPLGSDRRLLVRNDFYWNLAKREDLALFEEECDRRVFFRRGPYSISECRWTGPLREEDT